MFYFCIRILCFLNFECPTSDSGPFFINTYKYNDICWLLHAFKFAVAGFSDFVRKIKVVTKLFFVKVPYLIVLQNAKIESFSILKQGRNFSIYNVVVLLDTE